MIVILKIISILLMFSAAILIYTETTGIVVSVLPFVAGALLYTYAKSKKTYAPNQ